MADGIRHRHPELDEQPDPTVLRERVGDLALSGPLRDATRDRLEGLLKQTS